MEGRREWLLIGRLSVLGGEVPKDSGMAYTQSIPIVETGWKNLCSLNPGECQSLLLEIIWWPW